MLRGGSFASSRSAAALNDHLHIYVLMSICGNHMHFPMIDLMKRISPCAFSARDPKSRVNKNMFIRCIGTL
jgi:hypothetical protein